MTGRGSTDPLGAGASETVETEDPTLWGRVLPLPATTPNYLRLTPVFQFKVCMGGTAERVWTDVRRATGPFVGWYTGP